MLAAAQAACRRQAEASDPYLFGFGMQDVVGQAEGLVAARDELARRLRAAAADEIDRRKLAPLLDAIAAGSRELGAIAAADLAGDHDAVAERVARFGERTEPERAAQPPARARRLPRQSVSVMRSTSPVPACGRLVGHEQRALLVDVDAAGVDQRPGVHRDLRRRPAARGHGPEPAVVGRADRRQQRVAVDLEHVERAVAPEVEVDDVREAGRVRLVRRPSSGSTRKTEAPPNGNGKPVSWLM